MAPSLAYALVDHNPGAKDEKLGRLAAAGLLAIRPETPFAVAAMLLLDGSAGAYLYWRPDMCSSIVTRPIP